MKKQGYMQKYGLDATYVSVSDSAKALSSVVSGEVDMVRAAGFGQIMTAIEKGGQLKLIAGAGNLILQALYSSKPEVKTLKDLEGRVVGAGATGTLLHQMTVALLRKNGVDVDKVKFVNVGSNSDVFRAVVAGTIDAGPSQNDIHGEQEKWGVHAIAGGEFWKDLPEYPYQGGYSSDRTIAEKRDLLVRAIAAFGELYRFIESPNSYDVWLAAYNEASGAGNRNESTAKYLWQFMQDYKSFNLIISDQSINYLQNLNLEMGIQKTKLPIDKIADMSMAREAMKMIGA